MKTIQELRSKFSVRFFFALGLFALCCSLFVVTYNSHAQSQDNSRQRVAVNPTPTPTPTPKASPTPDEIIDDDEPIKVETDLVNLNVRVVDRNNRPVNDVKREEFKVYEDGVEQEIFNVVTEEVPISYGIAIDHSGSLRAQLQTVIEAGKKIISSNKEGDATFIVGFVSSDKIELLSDFATDKSFLNETLDQLVTEGGQTAIIDAVYLAAEKAANYKKGDPLSDKRRRALIVVTDGEDKSNSYTEKELFEYLREEDVQIYVIGFVNELDTEKSSFAAANVIRLLS